MNIVERAYRFADKAHEGQVRKYTFEPYINHPVKVCSFVETVTEDPEICAAALLHDVVEDTPYTLDDIEAEFGERVANLVFCLSDVASLADGNRAKRNLINVRHYACAHPDAKTVKLADLMDNIPSIIEHDPGFAKVYVAEKKMLLGVLKNGNTHLFKSVEEIIEEYEKNLP